MVTIAEALGIDDVPRSKLEAGVKMVITKFSIHKGTTFDTARIDALVAGQEMFYYAPNTAVVNQLRTLQEKGIVTDIEATTVIRQPTTAGGNPYLCLE